jgi:glutathione dehydrogenase/transferase
MLTTGPFTQRVLLTIEEKHLPYDLNLVDLANKPDWYLLTFLIILLADHLFNSSFGINHRAFACLIRLFQINSEGKVPIVKLEDKWVADSDVITQAIEEKYPEPPLETPPDKASMYAIYFQCSN